LSFARVHRVLNYNRTRLKVVAALKCGCFNARIYAPRGRFKDSAHTRAGRSSNRSTSHFIIDVDCDEACNLQVAQNLKKAFFCTPGYAGIPLQTISKTLVETMKIRLQTALMVLAISLTLPTFAQQTNAPDPQLRQMLDASIKKCDEAFNNNDAAALAALYTDDAVIVTDHGPIYGREALEKHFADLFKAIHISNHIGKADQYSPHIIGTAGNEMWANGEWRATLQGHGSGPIDVKGYWSAIKVREGDILKTLMATWNITLEPLAPSQTK
jgi:ketosteroid isomerase-like protein